MNDLAPIAALNVKLLINRRVLHGGANHGSGSAPIALTNRSIVSLGDGSSSCD